MGSKLDVEAIGREVRAGVLSNTEIARQFGCSEAYIRKLIKKYSWRRDLAGQVRERIHEKLYLESVEGPASAAEIVEAAATRGNEVMKLQRKDIAKLRELEQKIIAELSDDENPPTRVHVTSYLGKVTKTVLPVDAVGRAAAVSYLSNVQHKRIQLERQAYGLNDVKGDELGDLPREEVERRLAELEKRR